MKKRKEALQGANRFHYEKIFCAEAGIHRYFSKLLAAFCDHCFEYQYRNVDISIPKRF